MKKVLYILLSLFAIIPITQAQKIIKVGVFNYYPAVFQDEDGEIKGFYVDALNELGVKENLKFDYVFGTWNEGLERIKTGEVDLLTSVAITEERLDYMDYSAFPLLTVWSEVYIKPKSEINGIMDLKGKRIAVMKGDYNAIYFKQNTEKLAITCEYVETTDFEEVFKLIASGIVDAGIVNNIYGAPKSYDYGLISSGIIFNPFDIYFTVKKGSNEDLLKLLNTVLHSWKHDKNSAFNTSRQKWSHGNVGSIEVIPSWLRNGIYFVILIVLALITFIALLRYKVSAAIKKVNYSDKLFETFMDNTPAYVYIKDNNLNHIYRNRMVNSVNSVGPVVKYSSAKTIFEPHIADLVEKADMDILSSKKEQINIQYNCKLNGKDIWLHDYKFYLKQPDGNSAIGGISYDITKIKETELDLIKSKEKAEESDRLKTAFLQNMSHEIRTPMNAIIGFSSLMPSNFDNREKLENFSKIIELRCNDLLDIINDILDISKIESGLSTINFENCNINELFDELGLFFQDYKVRINKQNIRIFFEPEYEDSFIIIKTDKVKLKQIIINLISNALKFTEKGSITSGYKQEGNKLKFYISDTGIGIPNDKHDFIFERFSQLKHPSMQNIGGTGLGLPIVKGLVQLLGGNVWLESESNNGSTFYFTIDKIKADSTNVKNNTLVSKHKKISDRTILIVEDDLYNAEYLKEVVGKITANIITAVDGMSAVKIVKEQKIDLVLMDIRLPDITGYEAARSILQDQPNIKIIAQTAYASNVEHQKAIEAGCVDYISKPTKQEQLLKMVNKYLK